MGQPYIGEIRMFGGNFPPAGWMTCDGQIIPISQNETLFQLIGTTYGGDGVNTFQLPNLSGRAPVHMGTARTGTVYPIGLPAGVETVTLNTQQMPSHNHVTIADNNTTTTNQTAPASNFYGHLAAHNIYSSVATGLHPMMNLQNTGGSQPHENMQPFQAITFIISLYGVFPSQ